MNEHLQHLYHGLFGYTFCFCYMLNCVNCVKRNKNHNVGVCCSPSPRAKEIKSKLGVLLQKPDQNAIDLIIPYPEKTEKKPEKLQK